uniref:Uncharacterized protein n=1 Tax=Arundo donax TaxID=35708 RepID=A0A0A9D4E7_ARUDO
MVTLRRAYPKNPWQKQKIISIEDCEIVSVNRFLKEMFP